MDKCLLALAVLAALAVCGCREQAPSTPSATGARGATVKLPLQYKLVDTRSPGVEKLKGIALASDGRIYLAGAGGAVVFDPQWRRVGELPTPGAAMAVAVGSGAAPPAGAAGRVFVAEAQKVHVFDADGKLVASWGRPGGGPGEFRLLTGASVGGANIWLADAGNRLIHRFDITGDFIEDVGGRNPDTGASGIICPSPYLDCAAAPDGTLYLTNPGRWQVEHFDLNGKCLGFWGKRSEGPEGFSGCCNPTNIALLPDGKFVTAEKVVPRVKVLDGQGNLLALMGSDYFLEHRAGPPAAAGMDLAVDAAGRIYVADPASGKVLVFALDGGP